MSEPGSDEAWEEIWAYQARELGAYRKRLGALAFENRYEQMGRRAVQRFWRDGQPADLATNVSGAAFHKWAYRRFGRAPFTIWLSVPAEGEPAQPRFEFEKPPGAEELRTPALYVQELEHRPRPVELVPGWMKVELAAVGAWDLRADAPTWKDLEPTGEPQTPESVGVEPPPGAEWALNR